MSTIGFHRRCTYIFIFVWQCFLDEFSSTLFFGVQSKHIHDGRFHFRIVIIKQSRCGIKIVCIPTHCTNCNSTNISSIRTILCDFHQSCIYCRSRYSTQMMNCFSTSYKASVLNQLSSNAGNRISFFSLQPFEYPQTKSLTIRIYQSFFETVFCLFRFKDAQLFCCKLLHFFVARLQSRTDCFNVLLRNRRLDIRLRNRIGVGFHSCTGK